MIPRLQSLHERYPRLVQAGIGVAALILIYGLFCLLVRPSHERTWELGQEAIPTFELHENGVVTIRNFRDFDWQNPESDTLPRYVERTVSLDKIERVDVLISHFDDFEGLAHIFLSFGFTNGTQVAVSVETRRESDETFSPFWGMFRQFELIYVVGSERDLVGLRTDVRDERVYLYPTHATPEEARALFLMIAERANSLAERPRFYHTLFRNCTNEITRLVERVTDVRFPITWKTVLPGYFDEVLYTKRIIPTDAPFPEIKERYRINNEHADRHTDEFSTMIRTHHE